MVEEKEPLYFKEFRNLVGKRFDQLEEKIEREVRDLALSTAEEFGRIDDRFERLESDMAEIREYNRLIEQHIGRYEVRATTFEEILLKDFKPRILALEKLA